MKYLFLFTCILSVGFRLNAQNPVIFADVPDMSMIRVGDTYYMSSTTMHMSPGVPIMKSKDLTNWQLVNYAYETLEDDDQMSLVNGKNSYGKGSWASCIRYHNNTYYVSTFAENTGKTYIYTTKDIEKGHWIKHSFQPSLHDHTLFFDDDGKIYMIWGVKKLNIVELKDDLLGIKPETQRVLIENASAPAGDNIMLGAEGSQLFKVNGKYYLYNITWPRGGMRTVVIHRADKITGPYEGKLALQDLGVAQGGMVDTPDGRWFAYLFRDFGSVGRIPYIVPIKWENGWPVLGINGKVPETLDLPASKGLIPGIVASDEFSRKKGELALPLVWQWNHNPDNRFWSVTQRKGYLRLITGRIDTDILMARNMLTQRTIGPVCSGTACLETDRMKNGDRAGLCLLQSNYGLVGIKKIDGTQYVYMVNAGSGQPVEQASIPILAKKVYLKAECDFRDRTDIARFFYSLDAKKWDTIGEPLKMTYTLTHFMGYRFGLFNYATEEAGGYVDFDYFRISDNDNQSKSVSHFNYRSAGNPYLPLWEHLPDGEPRIFEDPDNPGKYRVYIIGSHDVRVNSYCGPDIREWSAPVDDLSEWRDEGSIFTYPIEGQWDVMFAPDLVEVKRKDGTKEYYLYPHSRGQNREAIVAKGYRPNGPFTPVNLTGDGTSTVPGSIMGFDPSVYIEYVTDPNDPDFDIGFRAYGYWGFQRSLAAELDQSTMYSLRPGTQIINYFIPASFRYGVIRDPEGTVYPSVYPDEDLRSFNFFEAASIRKVGNKFVWVYSGYSGPDYGLSSTNSALRYAFGDSPLGPWKSGGVLVDSRAPVVSRIDTALQTSYPGHNTHGSILLINDQWYVFYHRSPRGFGFARQPMVAPVKIEWDEKSVAEGGRVTIKAFDPYSKDNTWAAKDAQGREYTGAEVTSEGFHIYGLDPYQYYSAGYACYLPNQDTQQDSWDIWDNHMPITNIANGHIIGYKYFGFGGLDRDKKGLKAFDGTQPGNNTAFNLFLIPKTMSAFKVNVWLDGPWDNDMWKGIKIGEINVPANSAPEITNFTIDVSSFVDHLDKKHAIFLVAEGVDSDGLFDLIGLGFSSDKKKIVRPVAPTVRISVNDVKINLPANPVRSTNANGITGYDLYEVCVTLSPNTIQIPVVTATVSDPDVKIAITQAPSINGTSVVQFDNKGVVKTYRITFFSE